MHPTSPFGSGAWFFFLFPLDLESEEGRLLQFGNQPDLCRGGEMPSTCYVIVYASDQRAVAVLGDSFPVDWALVRLRSGQEDGWVPLPGQE